MESRGGPGNVNTSPIPTDVADGEYGSDPFADMNDGEVFQLEEQARTTQGAQGKRHRDEPIETLPRKRPALTQEEIAPSARSLRASSEDYGGNPFEELVVGDLDALVHGNPSARRSSDEDEAHPISERKKRDASQGLRRVRSDVEGNPASTGHRQRGVSEESELEYVIPNTLGENRTGESIPRLQARLGANAAKRKEWPPATDLRIYSHNFKVSRKFYKDILEKSGFAGELVYSLDKNLFELDPSPDLFPFIVLDNDEVFISSKGKILSSSNVRILAGFNKKNPIYHSIDNFFLSKTTPAERKLLGIEAATPVGPEPLKMTAHEFFQNNYDRLAADEKLAVLCRHEARVQRKHAIFEFSFQLKSKGHVSFDGEDVRHVDQLNSDQLLELLKRHVERCPADADKIFVRRDRPPPPYLYACSILTAMGLPERLATISAHGMPRFLDREKQGVIFGERRALLPPSTNICILVDSTAEPAYSRLNQNQLISITQQEKALLGFKPFWTYSLNSLERYKFGLLPPGSRALAEARRLDPDLAHYLADGLNEKSLVAKEKDGTVKHGADNSSSAAPPAARGSWDAQEAGAVDKRSRSSGLGL